MSEYECLDYILVNLSLQFTALNNIGLPLKSYITNYVHEVVCKYNLLLFSLINPFALVYPVQD